MLLDSAAPYCTWLLESFFGSLNPFAFSRDHGKEKFVLLSGKCLMLRFHFQRACVEPEMV